jgi:putative copper export protein
MRLLVIGLLIAILFSLGSGHFYLVRDRADQTRTLKALTWRIGLSIVLFIVVLLIGR